MKETLAVIFISCLHPAFSQDVSSRTAQAQENSVTTTTVNIDSSKKTQSSSVSTATIVSQTNGDCKDRKKINLTAPDSLLFIDPK
jgi:hypothetical protein